MPFPAVRQHDPNPVEPMQVDLPDTDTLIDDNFTVESPTLDLDSYCANYKGFTKIRRLLFVAKHCPSLEFDALRLAATNVKQTHNVELYKSVMHSFADARNRNRDSSSPEGQTDNCDVDQQWLETMTKRAQVKLEKLEQDLKYYKNNSIKESIRRGHDDLGDHYLDCGDLSNALKCYSRARDYCISAKHIINMCLNVIKVSVFLGNWAHVQTYVNKAEAVPDLSEQKEQSSYLVVLTKLKCAAGLAALANKQYKTAARLFLQASFDHCDYSEIVSAHDVAIYGGLCALATFDRQELQKKVLSGSSFKQFLELEPQLRDTLHKFYESKYASCLDLLENIKDNLMLDVYLSPHVSKLYLEIRNRALIQYFSPYVSADLHKMANAFNTSVADLEDELTQLILDGLISARIDSQNKVLYARDVDQRSTTFEKALAMGHEYQRRTKALILRSVIIKNQISVKSPPRDDETGAR